MRFFYAVILFLISSYLFFWLFVLLVPTPKVYVTDDIKALVQSDESDTRFVGMLERIQGESKKSVYYFEENLSSKKPGALLIYTFLTFVSIFFSVVLFHNKSFVVLPLIAATMVAYISCSLIWMLANSLPIGIYFDMLSARSAYSGLKIFQFLGVYLFMEAFVLIIGIWYKIP
jgi:hypothetical protein